MRKLQLEKKRIFVQHFKLTDCMRACMGENSALHIFKPQTHEQYIQLDWILNVGD